jgi:hypothetical protein
MDEKTFYESDGVKVTNARFIVNNQTYALSSVNSVKVYETDVTSSPAAPALLVGGGIVWMLFLIFSNGGVIYYIPSLALIAGGFYLAIIIKRKLEYIVALTTSSGENAALRSNKKQEITLIEKALNDAIVYRG